MSVVCSACGTANREKAKYCTGCARALPGFAPTGPSAFDELMSVRPSADAPPGRGPEVAALPAETPAFWLRAGYVA